MNRTQNNTTTVPVPPPTPVAPDTNETTTIVTTVAPTIVSLATQSASDKKPVLAATYKPSDFDLDINVQDVLRKAGDKVLDEWRVQQEAKESERKKKETERNKKINATHVEGAMVKRKTSINRPSILGYQIQKGLLPPLEQQLSAAVDQDNGHALADLAEQMREQKLRYKADKLASMLTRAISRKANPQVTTALAAVPPGVTPERLLALAAEGGDFELVKHLLDQGITPAVPSTDCPARGRQLLEDIVKAYSLSDQGHPPGAVTKAALEAALRNAEQTDRIVQTMQAILNEEDASNPYESLKTIVTGGQPHEKSQILKSFVQALDAREYAKHKSAEADNADEAKKIEQLWEDFDNLFTEIRQRLVPAIGEPNVDAVVGAIRGILEGVASTPELPGKIRNTLMDQVIQWLDNGAVVPDDAIPGLVTEIRQLMQTVSAEERPRYKSAEAVAHIRNIRANLKQKPDNELLSLVRELRGWMKYIPGRFQKSFASLMRQIDERDRTIGAIPEIAHIEWVGRPINGSELYNIVGFLHHNPNYTLIIDTDRTRSTTEAINRFLETNDGARELFDRVTVRNLYEMLPDSVTDMAKTREVKKEEILKVITLEMHGPGRHFSGVSNLSRLCALRSEKEINGQKLRGGLYFDADLVWLGKLPDLSSSLGIAINRGSDNKLNNNFIGCSQSVEVIDQFIVDLVYAYRRDQQDVEANVRSIESDYPDLANRVREMHREYVAKKAEIEKHASFNAGPKPLDGDLLYYFKEEAAPGDWEAKENAYAAKKKRAREILQGMHPSENPMDYARHVHATENYINTRFAFNLALSGPIRFRTSLTDMFGPFCFLNDDLCQLGKGGGMAHEPMFQGQIFTEVSDAKWANAPLGRRASVAGTTPKGELYYDDDRLPDDFYNGEDEN